MLPAEPMSRRETLGLLALLAGVALFSTIEIVSKAIGPRVHPLVLTFIRFFSAGVILLAVSARSMPVRPGARDYGIFLLNGLVGIALMGAIFQASVLMVGKAATCAVVFSANPLFVVIFARFINGEPWNPAKGVAVGLGVIGVAFFAWETGALTRASLLGIAVVLVSAALFAASLCLSRRVVGRYGALPLLGFSSLFGSLMVLPAAVWALGQTGWAGLWETRGLVAYHALVGTALAFSLYYFGLSRTSAYRASLSFFLKPVLASLLAAILLGERINAYMVAGTVFILGGLALAVLQRFVRIPGLSGRRAA
jgi:drug/metabolite transporter (DMT)-like permease